jgi:hypothetical protein
MGRMQSCGTRMLKQVVHRVITELLKDLTKET